MAEIDSLLSLNTGRQQPQAVEDNAAAPLLVTSTSMNVASIARADQSTFAAGPTIDQAGLELVRARNATKPNSSTSPAGQPVVGSSGGMP